MRAWAAEQDWLTLERLPAYAPELNPVELQWSSSRNVNSPTSPATTSPMLLTPPNKASTASTTTHNSHGHSSPTPDSPSTHHTHRTNEKRTCQQPCVSRLVSLDAEPVLEEQ
ncbi:hypothetical protein [Streptomyces sp. NPDC056682]|uniref:hypothetical protein n=1 Tax=Streptomyces sp. NPDC056682 TaxID=3345909 RepID=UPI0036A6F707